MTVIYRGLWQSEYDAGALGETRHAVARWVSGNPTVTDLQDGEHVYGDKTVRVREVSLESIVGFEAVVSDRRSAGGDSTVWRTTVSTVDDGASISTRVQVEMETDNAVAREIVGRPRVVADLLSFAHAPIYGGTSLWTAEHDVGLAEVPELIVTLRDEGRSLPFVVFSEPPSWVDMDWRTLAARVARRVQGVANVVLLGHEAVTAFKAELGSLAVWGGGVRTYAPGPLDGTGDAWRHRYVPARQAAASSDATVDRVVSAACQLSTRRHMPAEFSILEQWSPSSTASDDEHELLQMELEIARDDLDESNAELSRVAGRYGRLVDTLRRAGLDQYVWRAHDEPDDDSHLPDVAQDTSDAVLNAQHYLLETLFIPEDALADLNALDTAPNRSAWGNAAWRGFRALSAYARARHEGFEGGFWAWCERGDADAWPATKKKLSMTESETVKNSDKLMAARLFPVDPRVDPSGWVHMLAHLKIAEGGGRLAPRVYFHDDTAGETRAVHIGFVGPHYLVPNTKA